ncbi:3415_t:CDS:2, partial [Cetraspora pellucida]
CRFGYPKELHNSTIIQSDDNNQLELLLHRNDPLPVLSLHAALSYVAKYASKSEPRSKTFDEIFSDYLNSTRPDKPALKPIQKLLLHTVSERDFSAQETSHLLLKLPLVVSSSVFLILDLSEDVCFGSLWKDYCRLKVLFHIPHQNMSDFAQDNTNIDWIELYNQFSNEIELDGNDILDPWIQIATNNLQAINDSLGECSMDINHVWTGSYEAFPNLSEAASFLEQAKRDQIETAFYNNSDETFIDPATLNKKQKEIYDYVISYYSTVLTSSTDQPIEPLCAIVMGTAGTGKSYVIKAIRNRMIELAQEHNINPYEEPPILVLAPTGVAAFNINGCMIYSRLFLSTNIKNLELKPETLKKLQQKLRGIKVIIFDKKSMIDRRLLAVIDQRLRQAFPQNQNMLFGGCSVLFFGDFGQLPPVLDLPMYASDSRPNDSLSEANGQSMEDDWQLLNYRIYSLVLSVEKNIFENAIRLFTKWEKVHEYKIMKLKQLNSPVAKIKALHTGSEARRAPSDLTNGLEPVLFLSVGARLVNGAMGTIIDIIYELGKKPPLLPTLILLRMDNYTGPTLSMSNNLRVVPIRPIKYTWEGKLGICSRMQFPLCLAWAITIHKSQGLTLSQSVIDIGDKEFAIGLTFVAISRVRAIADLLFGSTFPYNRLQKLGESARLQQRLAEEQRLLSL